MLLATTESWIQFCFGKLSSSSQHQWPVSEKFSLGVFHSQTLQMHYSKTARALKYNSNVNHGGKFVGWSLNVCARRTVETFSSYINITCMYCIWTNPQLVCHLLFMKLILCISYFLDCRKYSQKKSMQHNTQFSETEVTKEYQKLYKDNFKIQFLKTS